MCLITNIKEPFIAEKDIICYKQVNVNGEGNFVTPYLYAKVQNVIESSSDEPLNEIKNIINYLIEDQGVHAYLKIDIPIFALKATIPKGTKFWFSNDFTEIAAKKLIVSDECVFTTAYSPDIHYLCGLVKDLNVDYPKIHNNVLSNVTHYSACKFVEKLGENWKLPTVEELKSVFSKLIYINTDRILHSNKPIEINNWYWSSELISSTFARNVNGDNGNVYYNSRSNRDTNSRVLAVSA